MKYAKMTVRNIARLMILSLVLALFCGLALTVSAMDGDAMEDDIFDDLETFTTVDSAESETDGSLEESLPEIDPSEPEMDDPFDDIEQFLETQAASSDSGKAETDKLDDDVELPAVVVGCIVAGAVVLVGIVAFLLYRFAVQKKKNPMKRPKKKKNKKK